MDRQDTSDLIKENSNEMIPDGFLLCSDQCLALSFAIREASSCRDPQLDNVWRVRDHGTFRDK